MPTVLLVENRQDDREMFAEYLRLHGFVTFEAGTTDEGLRRAVDVDVIVTGIRVSGSFDGLDLVRRLRATTQTRLKPVIVLTAWGPVKAREQAFAAGCDQFLLKPCVPDALVHEIRQALQLRRRPAEATDSAGDEGEDP